MKKIIQFGGRPLSIETDKVAGQADGAAWIQYGDTVVLVTAVISREENNELNFLPLIVDYQEKSFAAGKIPGGFFKREGKPTEKEILTSRLIDRSIRPLFPDLLFREIQVIATVLSADDVNDPEIISITGASVALMKSQIPFRGPVAGVRVGRVDGRYIINPSISERNKSDIDFVISCNRDGIIMVEGSAKEVSEEVVLDALDLAYRECMPLFEVQEEITKESPVQKIKPLWEEDESLAGMIEELFSTEISKALRITKKTERRACLDELRKQVIEKFSSDYQDKLWFIERAFAKVENKILREMVLKEGRRIDGRGPRDIREIRCEVGVLPRTHGSALFKRGETQVLTVTTLGTAEDEQIIDALYGESSKSFMLHYNFPPFCVGEIRFLRAPGRREVGHGALAERAIRAVLPAENDFPYTIRVVSEVLESNGSSSMATVCGATLSLMDAGVPIKKHVAGIAMGLMREGGRVIVLSDILGDEDHLGDMDFKVAGTVDGITALQMDVKIPGVTKDILMAAMLQARDGRLFIIEKMRETIERTREELSIYAPRIITTQIKTEKIKDLIGPGGKNIKGIIDQTGVKINVEDSGLVRIYSSNAKMAEKALEMIKTLTQEVEVGKVYLGKVKRIVDFGAFVEIFPGTDGLVHISQLDRRRINDVKEVVREGDEILVKVIEIDSQGKIKLSRKEALNDAEGHRFERRKGFRGDR